MISEEITIIDQYFRLADNSVLVELFKHLANFPIRKLRIMRSMDTVDAHSAYQQNYCQLNTQFIDFEWIKEPEKFFHDRYFITDTGAVRSGQGFMAEGEKPDRYSC